MPTPFHHALDRGDHRLAAEWLVRHHATAVLALCQGMVRDEALAEDLCQDAFTRAFGGLAGFRREAEPRTWLLAIARNRCLDELRRQGRNPVDPEEAIEEAPDERPLEAHLLGDRQAVQHALDSLGERDRAMVLLRFVHGLGYPELADAFGIKQGAARMRISRALARMRFVLAEPLPPLSAALDLDALSAEEVRGPAAPAPGAAPAPAAASKRQGRAAPRARRSWISRTRRAPPPPPVPPPTPTLATVLHAALPPSLAERLDALLPAR